MTAVGTWISLKGMRVLRAGSRLLVNVTLSRSSVLASQYTYKNVVPHWIVAGPRMSVGAAGSFQQACRDTVPLATSGQSGAFSPEIVSMRIGCKSPGLQAARSRSGLFRGMQGHNTLALITGRTRDLARAPWAPSTQGSRVLSIIPEDGVAGIKQRFKLILKEYGKILKKVEGWAQQDTDYSWQIKVALLSHFSIWGISLAVTYAALESMDINIILGYLPDSISSHIDQKAGAFAVAFVLTKLTGPARLMIDIAITPALARYLRNTWLSGPLGLRKSSDMVAAHPLGPGGKGRPDSYRVLGHFVRPYADAGRQRAEAAGGKLYKKAQAGTTRVRTAAGRVLIWARTRRRKASGKSQEPPRSAGGK